MKRRDLLAAMAATPLATFGGRLFAAPQGGAKLLVVFLCGGYDAASLLVPTRSDFYLETRPTIAIPRPGAGLGSALALDADWGLHPALATSTLPLYRAGELAFVPFAGADSVSRSHVDAQMRMGFGAAVSGLNLDGSACLGRLAGVLAGTQSAMTDSVSKGGRHPSKSAPLDAASGPSISTKRFAESAPQLARLMKNHVDVGVVDVGGWDTHVNQGGATGYLADRFSELGNGLASFRQEMGSAWSRTVVLVVSEFGRSIRENGNRGTEHGHGTVYWMLGGGIRGGRIVGEQRQLDATSLEQHHGFPVLNDHHQVLAGLLTQMYGLSAAQLDQVFPGNARRLTPHRYV